MSNLNRTLVLTAIIGSTLLTGCASFNRCASGTGNALTSGSVVDTLMGVVFVPLIPICTGVQAFASLDAEDQQALVHGTQQIASTVAVQRAQEQELKASRIAAEEARRREQAEQEARNKASQQRQQQAAMEASGLRRSQLVARPNEGSYTPPPTNSGIQIGNAKDVAKPEQAGRGNTSGGGGGGSSPVGSKYSTQDVTHCVELVSNDFKCKGKQRHMINICNEKISVWWRVGSESWGLQALAPGSCYPTSYYGSDDKYQVQYYACSWDPKAGHGPYKTRGEQCHY